ncbi:MAG: nucleotide exchange factor GrpE [Bacteroidetes bacterium]|nr:nucleotide exchange factor GrpE [Bacteroidota bacterium]
MTKDELKSYINEAVDALEQRELEWLFPPANQPDLFTVISEMIGLRGDVKKLAQATLKANNSLQTVVGELKQAEEDAAIESANTPTKKLQKEQLAILNNLIDQDDIIQRTADHFGQIPDLTWRNINQFKQQFSGWKSGYLIASSQWEHFIKNTGLHKTGLPGEVFNPLYHEAIETRKDTSKQENIILETEVTGYLCRQELVRTAKVIVNKIDQD